VTLALCLTSALAVVLFVMAATMWREFRLPDDMGYDLAFFNQGFYRALHGHVWFHSTIQEYIQKPIYHGLVLASHFSPIFYLFLPLYAVWQSPLLLLLIAAGAFAASGLAVLLVARHFVEGGTLALVWFILFALHPSIPWSLVDNGFREIFLGMGFLSFALLFYIKGNDRVFLLMIVLALLCKEDIALALPVWGAVAWFQGRGRRLAGGIALLGVLYFIAVNAVVLPLMRGQPIGQLHFEAVVTPLGASPGDIVRSIRSAPFILARLALSRRNLEYWGAIFSPLLFLPVLGWEYLVIPAYVYLEISWAPVLQQISLRHVSPALPFMFVAAIVGVSRLSRLVERMSPYGPPRSAVLRDLTVAVLLCGLAWSTFVRTPFPLLLRATWPTAAGARRDGPLFHALEPIPSRASLAATGSLIADSSSRSVLYAIVTDVSNFQTVLEQRPDYIAINLHDIYQAPPAGYWIASVLCRGAYGIVYRDLGSSRLLLARGATLSANQDAYQTLFRRPGRECPAPVQEAMDPQLFMRAARLHARTQLPSVVQSWDMFLEPVTAQPGRRFSQVIHLPDQRFDPGWYRVGLAGAWPWAGVSASYRVTARVLVGDRIVGETRSTGDQILRYDTPPFRITKRATLPVQIQAELQTPERGADSIWALRPTRQACAIVADAADLNPRQITVQARIFLEGLPRLRGAESEAPILNKNDALGYYLRLTRDEQGEVWVDFNVAGKWAVGRAGPVSVREWAVIAATYDEHEAAIYINGHRARQDRYRSAIYTGRMRSEGTPLVIGCRAPGRADVVVFPGLIGSAAVWNRVLTPVEIQENSSARSPLTSQASGLVGSWNFLGPPQSIVPDLSGAGHPVTNGVDLVRVAARDTARSFAAWRSRQLSLLRTVTVRRVVP